MSRGYPVSPGESSSACGGGRRSALRLSEVRTGPTSAGQGGRGENSGRRSGPPGRIVGLSTDHALDINKWVSGHNPLDGGSIIRLEWSSIVNRLYTVKETMSLFLPTWTPTVVIEEPGTGEP